MRTKHINILIIFLATYTLQGSLYAACCPSYNTTCEIASWTKEQCLKNANCNIFGCNCSGCQWDENEGTCKNGGSLPQGCSR